MDRYDPENPFDGVLEYEAKHPGIFEYPPKKTSKETPLPPALPEKLFGIIDSPTLRRLIEEGYPKTSQQDKEKLTKLNTRLKNIHWPLRRLKIKKAIAENVELKVNKRDIDKISKEYKINKTLTAAKLSNQLGPRIKKSATSLASKSRGFSFLHPKKRTEKPSNKPALDLTKKKPPLPPRPNRQPSSKIR